MNSLTVPSSRLRWIVFTAFLLLLPLGMNGLLRRGRAARPPSPENVATTANVSQTSQRSNDSRQAFFGSLGSFFTSSAPPVPNPVTPNIDIVFASNRDSRNSTVHHDDDCDRDFVGTFDIYGMKSDGTGVVRLTSDGALDLNPALSPDKTKIAFMSNRAGNFEIYVMNVNGTGLARLTTNSAFDGFPSWSPDGSKIVFKSTRAGNPEIYVMNSNGAGVTRLTTNSAIDTSPVFSSNGAKIAFVSNRDGALSIYSMNSNGSGVTRLTTGGLDLFPTWSPDGAKIAFMRVRFDLGEVYVMNANGSGATDITNNPAIDSEPSWAPNNKIFFTSTRNGNFEIYSMNPNGSGVTRLTNNSAWDISPNSQAGAATNTAPVVNAGSPQTITLPAGATLNGSATDDGLPNPPHALTYQWSQDSGPATASIATPTQATTNVSFPTAGVYVFRLTASDSALSGSATVQVTVNPRPNTAPVVSAGTNQTITLPANATLTGTATDDGQPNPPGMLTLLWSQVSGPATANIATPNQLSTQVTFPTAGTYVFRLTASDSALSNSATVQVTVNPQVNQPPNVNAGPNQTITMPANAVLNGSASDDGLPNPPIALTYAWSQDSGPVPAALSDPTKLVTTGTFVKPGVYVLRLTVSDSALSSSATTQITVLDGPPVLNVADRTIPVGTKISMQLAANDPNPSDTLTYFLDASPTGATFNANMITWTPTAAQVGDNAFTARVNDANGHSDTKTFHITVTPANQPPKLDAQADARVPTGGTFTRTLTATDADAGDVLTLALVSGPAGLTISGSQLSWSPVTTTPGDYVVKVKVTDTAGALDSTQFKLTVFPVSAPAARDDSYETSLGQTLFVAAPGVLGNDADPNGGTLTAAKLTDPDKGSVSAFNADGSFSYVAPLSPSGPVLDVTRALTIGGPGLGSYPLLVADIDGDGKPEIIYGNVAGNFNDITVVRGDTGALLFHVTALPPAQIGGQICNTFVAAFATLATGDVDDDGKAEIVLPVNCGATSASGTNVAAVGYDPSQPEGFRVKWLSPPLVNSPFSFGHLGLSNLSIARLRPNEAPTVLLGHTAATPGQCAAGVPGSTDNACRVVWALNGADGSLNHLYYAAPANQAQLGAYDSGGRGATGGYMGPVVTDINNDGTLEILYEKTLWNIDGSVQRQFDNDGTAFAAGQSSAVVDLDGDAQMEIVTLDAIGGVYGAGSLKAWKADGRLLWQVPLFRNDKVTELSIADVDRDGRPDIIFGIEELILVVDQSGRIKWIKNLRSAADNFSFLFGQGEKGTAFPVYDLNGDGIPEMVVQYGNNIIRFLRADTGEDETSYTMPEFPFFTGGAFAPAKPVVADIDGSGHASVLFYHKAQSFCNCESFVQVLRGDTVPWQPAPAHFNQQAYWESNFNANGSVPLTYPRQTTDPRTNVFGQQPQAPYAPGFVPATETSFNYSATNTAGLSSAAMVKIKFGPLNHTPVFTTKPPRHYVGPNGPAVDYFANAVDPDVGDTITYALDFFQGNNSGATIDANTGQVHIAPPINGDFNFIISARDNRGAVTYQAWVMHLVTGTAIVPGVVGMTQSNAASALTTAQLVAGEVTQQFNAAPAGTVLGQSPGAGTVLPQSEAVDLVVSSGPAPLVVPNVVGTAQSAATTTLSASGFTAAVTRVFSNTIPAGTVISQTPVAGTFLAPTPANPVTLTVSAGNGLALALNRSAATADQTITVTPQAFDVNGNPTALPTLSYAITPNPAPFAGLLPTITGTTINFDLTTMGSFTITATDTATSRSASANFAVLPPRVPGQVGNGESFAHMSEVLESIYALKPQLEAALAAHDNAQMTTLLQQIVTLWRQVDIDDLRISVPLVTPDQFPPTIDMMPGFGLSATPDDVISHQVLKDSITDLAAWTKGMKTSGLTLAQLNALADQFSTRAARMDGLTISEYGGINNSSQYTRLMSHAIPDFYEALTNELALLTGLPTRNPSFPLMAQNQSGAQSNGALSSLPLTARETSAPRKVKDRRSHHARRARTAIVPGTLAEQLTTIATKYVVDKIMDEADKLYKNAKQYAVDIMAQTAWSGAVVMITSHLRAFLQGKDIDAVFSGASLSFRVFQAAPAWIEAAGDEDPTVNVVLIIGPDLFTKSTASGQDFVKKLQEGYNKNLNPNTNPKRYRNANQVKNDLSQFLTIAKNALGDVNQFVAQQSKYVFQAPKETMNGCLLPGSAACRQLIYNDGFLPVYTYSPPPGFETLGGLPVPIIYIVYNAADGGMYFGTPSFLPCGYVDDDNNPNTPKKIQCPNSTPFLP